MITTSKLYAWKCHCEKLLNVEFPWDSDSPIQGPPIKITAEMVTKALFKMKKGP